MVFVKKFFKQDMFLGFIKAYITVCLMANSLINYRIYFLITGLFPWELHIILADIFNAVVSSEACRLLAF